MEAPILLLAALFLLAASVYSMAGFGGKTPNGIRIGPVYTPPEHRGRGYGTGWLKAEVLTEQGDVIPGYALDDCDELTGDSLEQVVTFRGSGGNAASNARLISPARS
jgi:GNAT superfamily N-acetyltransferase